MLPTTNQIKKTIQRMKMIFVEKVSGKNLSTNDYTTAEKNKLAGIAANANNYSLPTASSSTLGGVKTGSNITNSSGTISVTQANVTSALGYTPANSTVGTKTALGLSKLYDTTGSAVDGSITQAKITSELNLKANLASPTFTGTPKAPTAAAGTNTTQLATTEFVQAAKPAFGICSTGINASSKVVNIPGFILQPGARITVLFLYINQAELPTLNVNNTGAFPICYRDKVIATSYLRENMTLDLVYENRDGGRWHVIGEIGFAPMFWSRTGAVPYEIFGKPYLSPTYGAVKNAIHFDGRSCISFRDTIRFGGADFTIDFWAWLAAVQPSHSTGFLAFFGGKCSFRFRCYSGTMLTYFSDSNPQVNHTEGLEGCRGNLSHFALVYIHSQTTLKLFCNGVCVLNDTAFQVDAKDWFFQIGTTFNFEIEGNEFNDNAICAIDELRISKCARWTENFTPQSIAYEKDNDTLILLHCD